MFIIHFGYTTIYNNKIMQAKASGIMEVHRARGQESFLALSLSHRIKRDPGVSPPENLWKCYMQSGAFWQCTRSNFVKPDDFHRIDEQLWILRDLQDR